ncbi:MAG: radical SAM family heme chaperone HemW [Muribaculaceae bacterium]|nr:radical SAM family heme chaperone HemW [Muribaculaceae bacterium]
MSQKEELGIYIHIPFCRRKCIYCDFYSVGDRLADWERFGNALEAEFHSEKLSAGEISTLYIGGGTPSLAPVSLISRLRKMIGVERLKEFTIEVNPDDVTEEKARGWVLAGVDRISMGVQSLCDEELRSIGRRHDAAKAREAYEILRKHFSNISLDVMFGLPGQTMESFEKTISGIIEMRPEHISAYSLMYEERTALTRLRDIGKIEELPEEDSVEMFRMLNHCLREAGYERYEISNYSLLGRRSRHNSNYWKGFPYVGLGPGAHSYDGERIRSFNPADLSLYIKEGGKVEKGKEILSDEELREEMVMTRLRTCEGLNMKEFQYRFGEKERKILEKKAARFIKSGDLIISKNSLILSESGVMISDEIIAAIF